LKYGVFFSEIMEQNSKEHVIVSLNSTVFVLYTASLRPLRQMA
jgi:hypothetical protein